MSLVIKGGTIVAADRTYKADVLVEGETIKAIGEGLKGDSSLDAAGCFVMPGGVDPHVHLNVEKVDPTEPDWVDDYFSGSAAALGVDVHRLRRNLFIVTSLMAGVAVAVSGVIGLSPSDWTSL